MTEKDTTFSSKGKKIYQDIGILNIYASKSMEPKFIKNTLLQIITLMVGDLNTRLSPTDKPSRQKQSREIQG